MQSGCYIEKYHIFTASKCNPNHAQQQTQPVVLPGVDNLLHVCRSAVAGVLPTDYFECGYNLQNQCSGFEFNTHDACAEDQAEDQIDNDSSADVASDLPVVALRRVHVRILDLTDPIDDPHRGPDRSSNSQHAEEAAYDDDEDQTTVIARIPQKLRHNTINLEYFMIANKNTKE